MYLLSTHFARTGCTTEGGGCQACTVGSKDPNHQCVHIYSTHFSWTSCTTGVALSSLHSREQGPQSSVSTQIKHTLCLLGGGVGRCQSSVHNREQWPQSSVRIYITHTLLWPVELLRGCMCIISSTHFAWKSFTTFYFRTVLSSLVIVQRQAHITLMAPSCTKFRTTWGKL